MYVAYNNHPPSGISFVTGENTHGSDGLILELTLVRSFVGDMFCSRVSVGEHSPPNQVLPVVGIARE